MPKQVRHDISGSGMTLGIESKCNIHNLASGFNLIVLDFR
jgi:hypothetical protein